MFTCIWPLALDEAQSWRLRFLADYWETKKAGRALPERNDFDLADLKHILPYLLVAEIEPEPFRVFYRLTGTKVVEMCGDLTGRYLDQLGNSQSPWIKEGRDSYHQAWSSRSSFLGKYIWPTMRGAACTVEFGIFPLNVPGRPMQCFSLEDYHFRASSVASRDTLVPFTSKNNQ
ncbi:PAS domain-containing protein [Dongia soli]|uniref:PAS domain-containing protein n=1 Tax=Dongia soli TaxID=600628 RepID=A0ABU5EGU8_9PROT|nr:PAS domain-containing protein [Dongia soli]MDY0885655.1 PAS domain-containing protein [Dongia soli]